MNRFSILGVKGENILLMWTNQIELDLIIGPRLAHILTSLTLTNRYKCRMSFISDIPQAIPNTKIV
jgi:hypothetical protein